MTDVPNFLTFDIEEWYHANYPGQNVDRFRADPRWLEPLVDRLLVLCGEHGVRATFFIVGTVACEHPGMVKRISAAGHEVASHTYSHQSVCAMGPAEFAHDLARSCRLLESLTGQAVRGFRAPSFSVTREILPWFYETLERAGLTYSSSVFPGKTFLYGVPGFPRRVHRPLVGGHETSILEFPMTRVTLAGATLGLYLRLLPAFYLRRLIQAENRAGRPAILYVHPREIDPHQPRLPLNRTQSLIHYFGIRGCEQKLREVLRRTPRLIPLRDALRSWD